MRLGIFKWFRPRCPRLDKLDKFVTSGSPPGRIARHVAKCATCEKFVREVSGDLELLHELRSAVREGLDSPTRERILAICRTATADAAGAATDA